MRRSFSLLSSEIASYRKIIFICLFLFAIFTLPGNLALCFKILCLTAALGLFVRSSVLLCLIITFFTKDLQSIWIIYLLGSFLFLPRGNWFSLRENQASSSKFACISLWTYLGYLYLASIIHILGFNFPMLNVQDPWLNALPFYNGRVLAFLQLALALIVSFKGLSYRLWWVSLAFSGVSLIVEPTLYSLSFCLFHLFLFHPEYITYKESPSLILYDGACGLCHNFVCFILKSDRNQQLYCLPNNSSSIEDFLSVYPNLPYQKSIVYTAYKEEPTVRMEAVSDTLIALGGFHALIGDFIGIFPYKFTDPIYNIVAALRYKLFPKPQEECPVAPEEFKSQLTLPDNVI